MANDHSAVKARSGRNTHAKSNQARSKAIRARTLGSRYQRNAGAMLPQAPELGIRVKISGNLRTFLESEQDALSKTRSLLQCISNAMPGSLSPGTGPDYPEIIELAAELVRRRAYNLAELLDGRLPAVVTIC